MCATYYIAIDEREMQEIIEAVKKNNQNTPIATGDVYPKSIVPVYALNTDHKIEVRPMFWGFPLRGKKSVNFNARAENIIRYKMFRESKPIVIPTSGFYEWRSEDNRKQKYRFSSENESLTFIAGICNDFSYLNDGLYPFRFTMLTTEPTQKFREYHHREPLVLTSGEWQNWLKGDKKKRLDIRPPELFVQSV